jgi:hypothetical protein
MPAQIDGAGASGFSVALRLPVAHGQRACGTGQGHCGAAGIIEVMSNSRSRRFPVTVSHLPVTRCQICHRTVAYRPGNISEVLTEHYRRAHPEALGLPSR